MSAHHGEWEDIRENVLNYDEEGGGEQDQVSAHARAGILDGGGGEVDGAPNANYCASLSSHLHFYAF